jgi:Raf kinase inhibitor-like YbhB/YbcL family protein
MMNLIILYIMSITISTTLVIKSSSFENNEFIPSKYTCDGLNINPDISIDEVPENTESLAIIVDDPDSPNGTFCHWLMWDISPKSGIKADSAPGIQGRNSVGENKYSGPCPPSGKHHYHFKVYALDTKLSSLPPSTDQKEFEKAMKGHIVAWGELIGLYKR